jgi:uncharacterized protein involved in exopolysaccharide biosynthesis
MYQNQNLDTQPNEIDLIDLIAPLLVARKKILLYSLICGIFGLVIGFLTPATYTASSVFLPQTAQTGGAAGSLGGLAALAGINLSLPTEGGDIPSSMYATVLASEPFRMQILDAKIWVNGDSVAYRTYLENQPKSGISTLHEYTFGLPGKLIGIFSKSEEKEKKQNKNEVQGLQPLSNKEYGLLGAVSSKVSILNDKKEGVITITVVEGDPIIAAQVTKVTENVLQNWIREHKIKNTKAQYDFVTKQFEAKQNEFFSIQDKLAGYMDRNQNVLSASYLTRLERLQDEFDLVKAVYSELAKQKEQAAIQLSKDTPTFSVLNPVSIPQEKTGPKKSFYFFGFFIIAFICFSSWYLSFKPIKGIIKKLQIKS